MAVARGNPRATIRCICRRGQEQNVQEQQDQPQREYPGRRRRGYAQKRDKQIVDWAELAKPNLLRSLPRLVHVESEVLGLDFQPETMARGLLVHWIYPVAVPVMTTRPAETTVKVPVLPVAGFRPVAVALHTPDAFA